MKSIMTAEAVISGNDINALFRFQMETFAHGYMVQGG